MKEAGVGSSKQNNPPTPATIYRIIISFANINFGINNGRQSKCRCIRANGFVWVYVLRKRLCVDHIRLEMVYFCWIRQVLIVLLETLGLEAFHPQSPIRNYYERFPYLYCVHERLLWELMGREGKLHHLMRMQLALPFRAIHET